MSVIYYIEREPTVLKSNDYEIHLKYDHVDPSLLEYDIAGIHFQFNHQSDILKIINNI